MSFGVRIVLSGVVGRPFEFPRVSLPARRPTLMRSPSEESDSGSITAYRKQSNNHAVSRKSGRLDGTRFLSSTHQTTMGRNGYQPRWHHPSDSVRNEQLAHQVVDIHPYLTASNQTHQSGLVPWMNCKDKAVALEIEE